MYGQIHVIIRSLVTTKFGEDAWHNIMNIASLDEDEHFLVFHVYEDSLAFKLVGAASQVLGVGADVVLDAFGDHFITYCLEHGYDKMLRTLGDSFESFIQNLDSLHTLLRMSYTRMNAPSFRCIKESTGVYILHYYSRRIGLYTIVTGLMRAVGREFYGVRLKTDVLQVEEEEVEKGPQAHVTFRVTEVGPWDEDGSNSPTPLSKSLMEIRPIIPVIPTKTIVDPKMFCQVFPYHVIFDGDMAVQQCGIKLQTLIRSEACIGSHISQYFTILHPPVTVDFCKILEFINASYVISVNTRTKATEDNDDDISASSSTIILKGQMVSLPDEKHLLFIGSPRLASLTDMMERNLYLSDIPLYDVTRELVLLNQQRIAEIEVSKKLDETTAILKKTSRLLEMEKKKTDDLLYQMLPVKVADMLREGLKVAAEKYSSCTILFSDIVTFTNIASQVQPMEIVQMLNSLYSRFDALTSANGVYKVETIGDAYMVVAGVPEGSETHAQNMADQALGMIIKAAEVSSPATGVPLQIRVGIHSGPVVAGVVGDKMPRYCLFGDTVNTASRMESHGLPGCVHCSGAVHVELQKNPDYKLVPRGENMIKGKGMMMTYFLYTNGEITIDKPDQSEAGEENGTNTITPAEAKPTSEAPQSLAVTTQTSEMATQTSEDFAKQTKPTDVLKDCLKSVDDTISLHGVHVDKKDCFDKTCALM